MITYSCPRCGEKLVVAESRHGCVYVCPLCGTNTVVPTEPYHRARIAELSGKSLTTQLTDAELDQLAAHYEAVGDAELAEGARSAGRLMRRQREDEAAKASEAAAEAKYAVDTRQGICPGCGSRNVRAYKTGGQSTGAAEMACCVGCFVFWPALLLMPILNGKRPVVYRRRCNVCGTDWPV